MHHFHHEAMATAFQLRLSGADYKYCAQAALACWERLDALERVLSRFRDESSISQLNSAEAGADVQLHEDAYQCLLLAEEARLASGGAFDAAAATRPDPRCNGLSFYGSGFVVRVDVSGLKYDLGGIGKGYALDRMAEVLEEWSISSALLSGGGSSLLALGPQEGASGWEISLTGEFAEATVRFSHLSVGASGIAVKGAHIIDPASRSPALGKQRIWCFAESAAWSDAMSTAAFVRQSSTSPLPPLLHALEVIEDRSGGWFWRMPAGIDWLDRLLFSSRAKGDQ